MQNLEEGKDPLLSRVPSVARLNGGAGQIRSRSYTSSEDDTDVDEPEIKPAPIYRYVCASPGHRRQHLYVVLEDWKKGFSIHKFDLDDGSDVGGDLALRPPVHRQENALNCVRWNFAALGSKIVATGCLNYEDDFATIVYDAETAGLSIAPRLPIELHGAWELAAAMGNSLYVFEPNMQSTRWRGRCTVPSMDRPEAAPSSGYHERCWSWTSIPARPPFNTSGTESSALHPDVGRSTMFVSTEQWERNPAGGTWTLGDLVERPHLYTSTLHTFSYDAGSDEWGLPFYGRAHYNAALDVWVGFHKGSFRHDGYICASDVVSPDDGSPAQPSWKLCAERLLDPRAERHLAASLVHTDDMSYCLVEVVAREVQERAL
ncbi:hypothetical protein ACQ4PT_043227 [Festuca glaucescens]